MISRGVHFVFEIRLAAGFMNMFTRWIFNIFYKKSAVSCIKCCNKTMVRCELFLYSFPGRWKIYADLYNLLKNCLANQNLNLRYTRRLLEIWLVQPAEAQLCKEQTQTRSFHWSKWGNLNRDACRTRISRVFFRCFQDLGYCDFFWDRNRFSGIDIYLGCHRFLSIFLLLFLMKIWPHLFCTAM